MKMGSREDGTKRLFSLLFLLFWSFSRTQGRSEHELSRLVDNKSKLSLKYSFVNYNSTETNKMTDVNSSLDSKNQLSSSNYFTNFITQPKLEVLTVPIETGVFTKRLTELIQNEPVDDINIDLNTLFSVKSVDSDRNDNSIEWQQEAMNREFILEEPEFLLNDEDNDFSKEISVVGSDSKRSRVKRRVYDNMIRGSNGSPRSLKSPYQDSSEMGRQAPEANPDIDDIIHGIMKLLGGNVKLKAEQPDTKLTTFGMNPTKFVTSSRINNRGPPRLPALPFGMLPHGAPIRAPITSPSGLPEGLLPPFMANTRPPFLVPLPPALNAMPTIPKPTLTAIPIPEDMLLPPNGEITTSSTAETSVSPSFSVVTDHPTTTTSDSLLKNETETSASTQKETTPAIESNTPSIDSLSDNMVDSKTTVTPSLESSMISSTLSTLNSDTTSKMSTSKSINLISTPIKLSESSSESTTPLESFNPTMSIKEMPTEIISKKTPTSSSKEKEHLSSQDTSSVASNLLSATLPPSQHVDFIGLPSRLPDPIRPFVTTGHPGIVLADTIDYAQVQPHAQVITAPPQRPFDSRPEIFDVTVSALQGFGSAPVKPQLYPQYGAVNPLITSAGKPGDGSVYIDGRKTYFDLNPATAMNNGMQPMMGQGTAIPEEIDIGGQDFPSNIFNPPSRVPDPVPQPAPLPPLPARPATLGPPKRIDTCIVGYDTTCNEDLGEMCRTEGDVSSCFCRPGTARRRPRVKCNKSVLLHLSLKVDRVGDRRIIWGVNYANPESREYQVLAYEASKALESALSSSQAMSQLYLDSSVNKFYSLGGRVIVNSTVKLLHTPQTASPNIRKSLQRHLIRVIQGHNNYVGNSVLSVEGSLNPVPDVSDVNECFDPSLYDCHKDALCSNTFGSYTCSCSKGFTDRYPDDVSKSGRYCDSCSRDYCNKRGECRIENSQNVCVCENSFYGVKCEVDGEVVAVAVGASVAAVVIIILTLIFLCMWSRRWKANDRKTEIMTRRPGGFFGWRNRGGRDGFTGNGLQKNGCPPYGVTMEDRIRWAQIAEQMAHQNVYSPQEGDISDVTTAGTAISSLGTPSSSNSEGRRKVSRRWSRNGMFEDIIRVFSGRIQRAKDSQVEGHFTPEEANTLRQLINLQTRLAGESENQPEQMRPAPFYQEQRKTMPPPSEYASVGTLTGFPQQFGMQHMNAQYMPTYAPSMAQSTYGQYGPSSFNTCASIGGVSRAPTLGARTPQTLRDLGPASIGPLGGGMVSHKMKNEGGATESSEEEHDRPYHLPRPKSRSSALDSNDIYFEPDDLMTSRYPPIPSNPPPPVPFHFDHFFNMRFS